MKVKSLSLLAGATAAFALTAGALGDFFFDYTVNGEASGALGLSYSHFTLNGLNTLTISVTGVDAGAGTVGVLNVAVAPFLIYTGDGSLFANPANDNGWDGPKVPTGPAGGFFDPDGQDSGFMGLSGWDTGPGAGMTSWAINGTNITAFTQEGFWISLDPEGIPAPGGAIDILRVSWNEGTYAEGAFLFAVVDPLAGKTDEFYFEWTTIPAPGALALLGLAGLVGVRRRRA